jgi:hypothetical protein
MQLFVPRWVLTSPLFWFGFLRVRPELQSAIRILLANRLFVRQVFLSHISALNFNLSLLVYSLPSARRKQVSLDGSALPSWSLLLDSELFTPALCGRIELVSDQICDARECLQ